MWRTYRNSHSCHIWVPSWYQVFKLTWTISFWNKNNIEDQDLDKNPYPWIIWYFWKAQNDKIFRGIDRASLEPIRYAEGECQYRFSVNVTFPTTSHPLSTTVSQDMLGEHIFSRLIMVSHLSV